MITLPNTQLLIQNVRDALDAVAIQHSSAAIRNKDWFRTIAREIAGRLKKQQPSLECYYNKGAPPDCDGREWNSLDFLALARDPSLVNQDWLPMQAVVVGEVEIATDKTDGINYDFEKLLIVDALLFFMVFKQYASDDAASQLSRLERASKRRQDYARLRGNVPPSFLLSCWVDHASHFEHRWG